MHLRACLPLALLSLCLPCNSSQIPWTSPSTKSTTLVDALNADPDYSSLLYLLQRARLIPTLNRLNGSTFFAPTNEAIKRHSLTNSLWRSVLEDGYDYVPDNVQEQLRQQLFYHLLNYTLSGVPAEPDVQVHKSLLFPRKPFEPPSRDPPPSPPWMPLPGGTLGGEPQRLRLAAHGQVANVGVDAFGKGGAKIIKGIQDAGNGILLGIADVLEPPADMATVISQYTSVSYFQKIMTPEIMARLNSTSELTLFLPVDEAWDALDHVERLYLESEFATDDLRRILDMHAVVQDHVTWSDAFGPALNLTTVEGTNLDIVVTPEGTKIKDANLVQPDIYASNGVLHLVSSLLLPPNALQLTAEKYLLALNCTKFVSLLHSVDLTQLINNTDTKYTILAPRDDIFLFGEPELPERGSEELKRLLQYHFIPGRWTPNKLKNGTLLETALQEPGLNGGRQVLPIQVNSDGKKSADKGIRFGDAGVIGDPIEVNNTLIYFVSRPLVPPSDALQTALPSLDLSAFLAAVFSTSKAELLRETPSTSLLIPHNQAFKRLGLLVSAHLLAASSKDDLENVILHHALNTVEYAQSLQNGSQHTFATLEGTDVKFDRLTNGTSFISSSGGWAGLQAELYPRDLLTQTGVIHELSDILIPRSVKLTVGKLVKAAKGSTMATLVNKAGFDWILNGTTPPEGSHWANESYGSAGWTLLCPLDDAFKDYNLTQLYSDLEGLTRIVTQHLIPSPPTSFKSKEAEQHPTNNNRPLVLDDATYSTIHSASSAYGDIVFQQRSDSKEYVVGIKGARGTKGEADHARVLSWGRSTTGGGTGGVIQIDRLLIPYQPSWWNEYGAPSAVGGFGMLVICAFFYGVRMSSEAPAVEETRVGAAESVKSFIAGGFGGVAAVLVGHPFDLTKTRLQTAAPGAYTGAIDVVKKTVARDGITGLYRGMVPPLLGVTPIFAVSFWAYDTSKQLIFALTPDRKSESLSVAELALAGFLSAVPTTLVTAPVERAKVLLQVQGQGGSERKYKGVTDVLKHLYKEGGMRSIFRGTGATLARDGPGSAAYFAAYEVTKKALTPAGSSPSELNLSAIIIAGGTAGVAMWALAIPPDVLKSRIQSAPTGTYSGLLDCARKTIAQDGVRALWKGFGPAMARAFPANAATFLGVEFSRKVLDGLF
ncbi:carnitine acyl carnitine carrier [Crassisporium funariophilum]|nr:carnitine acyl carnitine carrier [Crassisporium funariophilum]